MDELLLHVFQGLSRDLKNFLLLCKFGGDCGINLGPWVRTQLEAAECLQNLYEWRNHCYVSKSPFVLLYILCGCFGGGPLIPWEHLMEGRGLKLKCMTVQSWRTGLKSKRSKRWTEGWRKWGFEERHQRIKVKIQNSKRWKEKQGDEKGETLVESFWENKFPKEAIELINYT